jgi:hypothetical protein
MQREKTRMYLMELDWNWYELSYYKIEKYTISV